MIAPMDRDLDYPKLGNAHHATRTPKRVTATIPWSLLEKLISKSAEEGRSLSNLISYLLERSIEH